jgi:hypothetical protein
MDLFMQVNERLERDCLRFLWESSDSCKTIANIILSILPANLAKVIKKEAVLGPEALKSELKFFNMCEKFMVEFDQFQFMQSI